MTGKAGHFGLDELIDELSRVFHDPGEAHELARRAGFPVVDMPAFGTGPAVVFWGRLVRAAADGKLLGGVEAIIEQAKARFPHNPFFATYGSKTVIAPMQPGPRLAHAVDQPRASGMLDPNVNATRARGAANHEPNAEGPDHPPGLRKDATSMNTNQSPYPPNMYTPPPNPPMGAVGHTGRGASGHIKIDARNKTDNRKGLGAVGVTAIVLVMGAALCTMGWLAFDAVKSLPRNSDGSVTVWGVVTLPVSVVGEPAPAHSEDEETKAASSATASPPPPTHVPKAVTREELEGVWGCNGGYPLTFSESGRIAFSNAGGYPGTPFAKWTDQPYTMVSAKTIEVGGMTAQIEVSADEQTLRIVGGNQVFMCKKQAF